LGLLRANVPRSCSHFSFQIEWVWRNGAFAPRKHPAKIKRKKVLLKAQVGSCCVSLHPS
jgi:hypothetical protein